MLMWRNLVFTLLLIIVELNKPYLNRYLNYIVVNSLIFSSSKALEKYQLFMYIAMACKALRVFMLVLTLFHQILRKASRLSKAYLKHSILLFSINFCHSRMFERIPDHLCYLSVVKSEFQHNYLPSLRVFFGASVTVGFQAFSIGRQAEVQRLKSLRFYLLQNRSQALIKACNFVILKL